MNVNPVNPELISKKAVPPANGFATASLVLGILAIVSSATMTILFPLLFGGLSILLAVLSRGGFYRYSFRARVGLATALGAVLLNCSVIGVFVYQFATDSQMRQEYFMMADQLYEQMTGVSLGELLESYGVNLPPEYLLPQEGVPQ